MQRNLFDSKIIAMNIDQGLGSFIDHVILKKQLNFELS